MEMATNACVMANGVVAHVQTRHVSRTTTAERTVTVRMMEMATNATAVANGVVPCVQTFMGYRCVSAPAFSLQPWSGASGLPGPAPSVFLAAYLCFRTPLSSSFCSLFIFHPCSFLALGRRR